MTPLRAAWLGSWKAPWSFGRGRRWGDHAWALAAIAQAWLLGGRERRWPHITWTARPSLGPRPGGLPEHHSPIPPPEWVSLLRHGTSRLDPDLRGRSESDLVHACWQALRAGDGDPWMGLGTVLLDRRTRSRWIPLLGAVDGQGCLHLPPFLSTLIPPEMHRLPPGWWEFLLSHSDPSGVLHPDPEPVEEPDWGLLDPALRPFLRPLVLRDRPRGFSPRQAERWLLELSRDLWMVDPRLRAWARGDGLGPAALATLIPASLEWGDDIPFEATTSAGTPNAGTRPPLACADPGKWLSSGIEAMKSHAYPEALEALRWAHAHFSRLGRSEQACVAASRAAVAACGTGDLPEAARWRKAASGLTTPFSAEEEARWRLAQGAGEGTLEWLRQEVARHPEPGAVGTLLVREALLAGRRDWIPATCLEASKGVADRSHPDLSLAEAFRRCQEGTSAPTAFWDIWDRCPDQPLRLEAGLRMLETRPDQCVPRRLLELQALAQRTGVAAHRLRIESLWPHETSQEPEPTSVLEAWVQTCSTTTWISWETEAGLVMKGQGPLPPDSLRSALQARDSVGPLEYGGELWKGLALHWEGTRVGSLMTVIDAQTVVDTPPTHQLIAPWLARLVRPTPPGPPPEGGRLLTDGSEPMAALLRDLERVAPTLLPVLILGPTGSGKELVAREIHTRSKRKGAFVPVNCSEFVETLMESELFGHIRGSFTGADRDRKGSIEQAEGGTLFLDEVADLPPRLQSLFLRVLQEREIRRVGSERIHKVDVRFLAATHRDLETLVASGQFRRDLHYRLQGMILQVPALHERGHEFPYLIPRLTARIAEEAGLQPPELAPGLAAALARHPWPGNFRELGHAIERALLRREGNLLKASHFTELSHPDQRRRTWIEANRVFQQELLVNTLRKHHFRVTETAEALALTRPALYAAAKRLGVDLSAERASWEVLSSRTGPACGRIVGREI